LGIGSGYGPFDGGVVEGNVGEVGRAVSHDCEGDGFDLGFGLGVVEGGGAEGGWGVVGELVESYSRVGWMEWDNVLVVVIGMIIVILFVA